MRDIRQAEYSLVASLIQSPEFFREDLVDGMDFLSQRAESLFTAFADEYMRSGRDETLDYMALLSARNGLDVEALYDWVAAGNVTYDKRVFDELAEILIDETRKRRILKALEDAKSRVDAGKYGEAERIVEKAFDEAAKSGQENEKEIWKRAAGELAERSRSGATFLRPTGIYKLDVHVGGLVVGEPNLFAATSGTGKTLFALQVARNFVGRGEKVLYVLGESTRENLLMRLALAKLGWGVEKLSTTLQGDDHKRFVAALESVANEFSDKFVVMDGGISPLSIAARMRRFDLVIVDHLEQVTMAGSRKSKTERMEEVVEELREANKDARNVLLLLQQISLDAGRRNEKPTEVDLRWTRASFNAAALVLVGWRDREVFGHRVPYLIIPRKVRYGGNVDVGIQLLVDLRKQEITDGKLYGGKK